MPLLRELLGLDIAYRHKLGDKPTAEQYVKRFPDRAKTVAALVRHMDGAALMAGAKALQHKVGAALTDHPDATLGYMANTGVADKPASSLSRFSILREHKEGGLGLVYLARDQELQRDVALKEIKPAHCGNKESRARFVLEAEITGNLEHPGIVPVYGLGCYADGRPYYAMRFIRGDTLAAAIERFHGQAPVRFDSLECRQLLGRLVAVCQAVAYAHNRGVLHRDLKPGNIMLGKFGETLLVDWGLAKVIARPDSAAVAPGDEGLLRPFGAAAQATVGVVGTPAYMSPEQAKMEELGPATDVYSLGATLYCLLTNRAPSKARWSRCCGRWSVVHGCRRVR